MSAKNGSGKTHVRYGHKHRPALLHVSCPQCSSEAVAQKPSEREMGNHVMDLSGTLSETTWEVRCLQCPYAKKNLGFEELPTLYYRAEVRDQEVWGWNREHFEMILHVLEDKDVSHHKYAWFKTYIKGDWLKGSMKKALAKVIRKKLEKH